MNSQKLRSIQLIASLSLGLAALLVSTTASAQKTVEPAADEAVWGSSSASGSGDASDLMDILQRGQVGPSQTNAEFREKQDEESKEAIEAYLEQRSKSISIFPKRRPSDRSAQPTLPTSESSALTPDAQSMPANAAESVTETSATESAETVRSTNLDEAPRPALW